MAALFVTHRHAQTTTRRYRDEREFRRFKDDLTQALTSRLGPISAELRRLEKDPEYLRGVLQQGGELASEHAAETMSRVHSIIGTARRA